MSEQKEQVEKRSWDGKKFRELVKLKKDQESWSILNKERLRKIRLKNIFPTPIASTMLKEETLQVLNRSKQVWPLLYNIYLKIWMSNKMTNQKKDITLEERVKLSMITGNVVVCGKTLKKITKNSELIWSGKIISSYTFLFCGPLALLYPKISKAFCSGLQMNLLSTCPCDVYCGPRFPILLSSLNTFIQGLARIFMFYFFSLQLPVISVMRETGVPLLPDVGAIVTCKVSWS